MDHHCVSPLGWASDQGRLQGALGLAAKVALPLGRATWWRCLLPPPPI
jgi:hypothetical protein